MLRGLGLCGAASTVCLVIAFAAQGPRQSASTRAANPHRGASHGPHLSLFASSPAGEWWGVSNGFDVMMSLRNGVGTAAIRTDDGAYVFDAHFSLASTSDEARFDYVLTSLDLRLRLECRIPPPWDTWEPGDPVPRTEEESFVVLRVVGDWGLRAGPFRMFRTTSHPPQMSASVRERLRALVRAGSDG